MHGMVQEAASSVTSQHDQEDVGLAVEGRPWYRPSKCAKVIGESTRPQEQRTSFTIKGAGDGDSCRLKRSTFVAQPRKSNKKTTSHQLKEWTSCTWTEFS